MHVYTYICIFIFVHIYIHHMYINTYVHINHIYIYAYVCMCEREGQIRISGYRMCVELMVRMRLCLAANYHNQRYTSINSRRTSTNTRVLRTQHT